MYNPCKFDGKNEVIKFSSQNEPLHIGSLTLKYFHSKYKGLFRKYIAILTHLYSQQVRLAYHIVDLYIHRGIKKIKWAFGAEDHRSKRTIRECPK